MPALDPTKRRFSVEEACAALEIQEAQFREYVRAGIYPRGRKRGKKLLFWTYEDLMGMLWLEENLERFAWFGIQGELGPEESVPPI